MKLQKVVLVCMTVIIPWMVEAGKNVIPAITPVAPVEVVLSNPWYLGLGFARGDFSKSTNKCHYQDVTYGVMLRGGYEWNQYIGLEARALRTFWGKGPNGGELLQHVGLFLKPALPLGDRLNLYGLLGYGWTKSINEGGNGNLPSLSEKGFSWGIGLEYDLSDRQDDFIAEGSYDRAFDGHGDQGRGWTLFVDYQKLIVDSDLPDMSIVSMGGRYDF